MTTFVQETKENESDSHLVEHAFLTLWTMAILDFLGSCSVHFAISIWTLISVAVLFGESSKNFQRYCADSETLHRVLKECTKELDGNKLCGFVTDGASTMTSKINGLAARIKREHPVSPINTNVSCRVPWDL
jgi:hypothetical protein